MRERLKAVPSAALNRARYGIAWGALGAAEFCWHAARQLHPRSPAIRASTRRQPTDPVQAGEYAEQTLRFGLQGALRVGRLFDQGEATPEMISLVKRNSCAKPRWISPAYRAICTAATASLMNSTSSAMS